MGGLVALKSRNIFD